ncbi:MAG TPA: choice-of-anchor tandem repeat NxxGxxAF-containing protein [Verrucomicrobiales bacterium]|nr:choice-of-anchor tandem repeat NxxGxxAF-containing protein [Verrucomicrobiales bacterium]
MIAIATAGFAVISTVPLPAADVTNTVVVATSGDAPPEGAGELADLEPPVLGNGGMAAFAANIRQGATKTGSGIFLGDSTHLVGVVLEGDSTPNQDGEFGAFTTLVSTPRINAANQVAFRNSLDYDPDEGLLSVIRHGETFPGMSAMSGLNFYGGTGIVGSEGSGLNDLGQVAYRAFVGAHHVVAIWSGPRSAAPEQPIVHIGLTQDGLLRISWNLVDDTWKLTAADQLMSINWNEVNVEPVVQDGVKSVELPLSDLVQFFRLSKE